MTYEYDRNTIASFFKLICYWTLNNLVECVCQYMLTSQVIDQVPGKLFLSSKFQVILSSIDLYSSLWQPTAVAGDQLICSV